MTNNEARENYRASMEHHKAYIILYQTKVLITTGEDQQRNLQTLQQHVHNLVEVVDGYKGIDANEDTFIGSRADLYRAREKHLNAERD